MGFWLTPEEKLEYKRKAELTNQRLKELAKNGYKTDSTRRIEDFSNKLISTGNKLTKGITIPIFLFIFGFFFLPFGLILWLIGLGMFADAFMPKEKK